MFNALEYIDQLKLSPILDPRVREAATWLSDEEFKAKILAVQEWIPIALGHENPVERKRARLSLIMLATELGFFVPGGTGSPELLAFRLLTQLPVPVE